MNWDETMKLLHKGDWQGRRAGFDRLRELLARLGSPEKQLRFVHVAGSNGKGSASVMLARILEDAGYRTGLYISPHIRDINERWSINGVNISDERLSYFAERVRLASLDMEESPTSFELLTVLGLLYFFSEGCEIVVLEVGLGGRLDATNVIPTPLCALIMHIGLEHTELLGDSLGDIAEEKGGIIKENGDVVLYRQCSEVEQRIRRLCLERAARLRITEDIGSVSTDGSFSYKGLKGLSLSLSAPYQRENAAAVLECIELLREKGMEIPESAVLKGLGRAEWQGRFEIISREPLIIIDGAHNPNGVEALRSSLMELFPERRLILLMGVMENKNHREMLEIMAPLADCFIATAPDESERALPVEMLAQEIKECFSGELYTAASLSEAAELGIRLIKKNTESNRTGNNTKQALVCFGSLYQIAELKRHLSAAMQQSD